MTSEAPRRRPTYRIYLLFLLSGAAGLVYQVVWSRLLNEIFGVTIYAIATVLATFLAGLALGGLILGRWADRSPSPLRLYGWLEIGIGLLALAGTGVTRLLDPVDLWVADRFTIHSPVLIGVRILLSSLVVLPATFLMGGTLPVITRAFVQRIGRFSRDLSVLYALNTLGAVAGSLVTGFLLIRLCGLHATLLIAVTVNLIVGVVMLRLARGLAVPHVADTPEPDGAVRPATAGAGLLVVVAFAGFVTLGLEVLWTRILMLSVGTTTYSFVTMLSTFLMGIALGSFLVRAVMERIREPRRMFGWVQLGIAATTLATLPLPGTGLLQLWLQGGGESWLTLTGKGFATSFLIMLVPTLLIGFAFPLAGRIWARELHSLGRKLGQVYAANTAGNVAGAMATGFFLIPVFGLQRSIVVLSALSLVNAAWGLFPQRERSRLRWSVRAAPALGAILLCASLLIVWEPRPLLAHDEGDDDRTLYYNEGIVSTVKVLQKIRSPVQMRMTVDGVGIGQSYGGVDAKQQALAHFPFLLLREPPRHVLSIGLGTGILIGEVVKHPGVESVECLEISPSVIEAARLFDDFNGRIRDNPQVRIVNDDGVNYLRRSGARYDAIISDAKSRTAHAANGLFFSSDYYRLSRDHLAHGGLMIQWVPLTVPSRELGIILRTFVSVFSNAYVWVVPPHSCFLVGTEQPLTLDLAHIDHVLQAPATENLKRYGWRGAYGFASFLTADRESMRGLLEQDRTINSLEHPVLEFYGLRDYETSPSERRAANLVMLHRVRIASFDGLTVLNADPVRLERYFEAAGLFLEAWSVLEHPAGDIDTALNRLDRALGTAPEHGPLRYLAAAAYDRALQFEPDSVELHMRLGKLLHARGLPDLAADQFRQALALDPERVEAHYNLGLTFGVRGQFEEAASEFRKALDLDPEHALAHAHLGIALTGLKRFGEALEHFRHAERLGPLEAGALSYLAYALIMNPDPGSRDPERAVRLAERAAELTRYRQPVILNTLAEAYAANGRFDQAVRIAEAALARSSEFADDSLPREIRDRLSCYRQSRRYETPPTP